MARLIFSLLMLFLFPAAVYAQDGPSAAIAIVEDFNREANILMKDAGLGPLPGAARDRAIEDLGNMRIAEQPGAKRSGRVYGVADSYMSEVLKQIDGLKTGASEKSRRNIDAIAGKLKGQKQLSLESIKKTLSAETSLKKEPKEVPSFDSSPFDEPPAQPEGPPGILYR